MTDESIDINGSQQKTLALSSAAAQTGVLKPGKYDIWCDVECFIKIGALGTDVTIANGYPIISGNVVGPFEVGAGCRIGGIVAAGTGTLKYHRVGG